jgi:Na+/H+ antiporter NhaD/arsenite permease-like protein
MPVSEFARPDAHQLIGSQLSLVWAIPFTGILLSIALLPLLASRFWEHNFSKIAVFWSLSFLLSCAITFGPYTAASVAAHTLVIEYMPFLILLFALFVIAGGIRLAADRIATPGTNTAMLAFGAMIASVVGTTGASMLLIRPTIHANHRRQYNLHVFIFFIFLVSNIGGSVTPWAIHPSFSVS